MSKVRISKGLVFHEDKRSSEPMVCIRGLEDKTWDSGFVYITEEEASDLQEQLAKVKDQNASIIFQ